MYSFYYFICYPVHIVTPCKNKTSHINRQNKSIMALSKVKSKKQKKRLEARQKEYELIPDKTGFKKPGSNRK